MNRGLHLIRQKIALLFICCLGILPMAFAQDYWGQKVIKQPSDFIFGYGSLINSASRNSSVTTPIQAVPVRVSAQFGFTRVWNDRAPSGFTALGLRKADAAMPATTINGVLFPVAGGDIAAYDKREEGYARIEIPRANIEALSWQGIPKEGRIWVYVPVRSGSEPGVGLPIPNGRYPLLQSYIDVVVEGGLEYGEEYAKELIATTKGWSNHWLNDRLLARRPWVNDSKYSTVDTLLSAVPAIKSRLLPEDYAAQLAISSK